MGDDAQSASPVLGLELEQALGQINDEAQKRELVHAAWRRDQMRKIASYRWAIGSTIHRLSNNKPMDFAAYHFQPEIYQDAAPEMVVMGSVQWGKSLFLICTAAAMAASGLKVFYIISKFDKRNKVIQEQINPAFNTVPLYKQLIAQAKAEGRDSDSVGFKHFGPGSINFVGSNSPKEFSGYQADATITDDHQDCNLDNVGMADDRMSGSQYQFKIIVGNPREPGSPQNRNIDQQYRMSDQREWHVRCGTCQEPQILGWLTHVVRQEVNKSGAITNCSPRDEQWDPKSDFDMRAICTECFRPMDRLTTDAYWQAMNPGVARHGFRLSNLYNPRQSVKGMYERYLLAKNSPSELGKFLNNQMGQAFAPEGMQVTEAMIENASSGALTCVPTYQFIPTNMMPLAA